MIKVFKNGLIILLLIIVAGSIAFSNIRNHAQAKLDARIVRSLELNREAAELFSRGEYHEARKLLYESLSLNRLNAETYVYLAFAELKLENRRAAYEHFASALNMEATSVEMVASLADILLESGYYQEAEKYLKEGLKDFPGEGELLFRLGQASLLKGDLKGAISSLERLLEENDSFLESYKYLGLAYYYAGEREKAAENYSEYLRQRGIIKPKPEPDSDSEADADAETEAKAEYEDVKMTPELLHEKVLALWGEGESHGN